MLHIPQWLDGWLDSVESNQSVLWLLLNSNATTFHAVDVSGLMSINWTAHVE